jgi:hypothetical protein
VSCRQQPKPIRCELRRGVRCLLLARSKVKRLEETLNSEPDVRTKAAPILRTLIDEIVLHAGDKRGKMSIEVYGEPSALFP